MRSATRNGGIMTPATSYTRELAARESDGTHVLLLRHPDEKRAETPVIGWLALVVAADALGGAVGTKHADSNTAGSGELAAWTGSSTLGSSSRRERAPS